MKKINHSELRERTICDETMIEYCSDRQLTVRQEACLCVALTTTTTL